jgi:hypothetical protein
MITSSNLAGRATDDEQSTWVNKDGQWTVGGLAGGSVWPTVPATRSLAVLTGPANTLLGVTLLTNPATASEGLVFRYSNDSNYWQVTQTVLRKKVAGSWTTVATHSTPFAPLDRMTALLNGSSITVYQNGDNVVSTATDAFNSTATLHGIVCE